jgi:hypothetical protein
MASQFKTRNKHSERPILAILLSFRVPFYLALCLIFSLCANRLCAEVSADNFTDSAASSVAKLEEKFFQHSYGKDDTQVRLERLEKMVFGSAHTGSTSERVTDLLKAVPVTQSADASNAGDQTDASQAITSKKPKSEKTKAPPTASQGDSQDSTIADGSASDYPAVTAMEKKSLGKTYVGEPVSRRLDRLETKEFGRPSSSTDLSERVDRLKQRTGVDIARMAPAGSDWTDDDDDNAMPMPITQAPTGKPGEDGRSFSGHDMRADMKKAFGMPGSRTYGGSSGSYGMNDYGGGAGGGSGAYGFGAGASAVDSLSDTLPTAPPRKKVSSGDDPYVASMGLNQQVTALENEIFGKTYAKEALPVRLNRLEATVFPKDKPASDQPLPDRVKRLLAAVPISEQRITTRSRHSDPDLDLSDSLDDAGLNGTGTQAQHSRSGLSKIIGQLGNLLGGSSIGGYPMQTGTYITDPQTGMLLDQYTGNLINPATGAIVGTRSVPMYGSGMYSGGLGNYGSFGSFGNGFSPYGTPYGSPYYGGMSPGLHFGFGGGGLGGMWP